MLHKAISILHTEDSVPNLDLSSLLISGKQTEQFKTQCSIAVNFLIECNKFSEAQDFAVIVCLEQDKIVLCKVGYKPTLVNCLMFMVSTVCMYVMHCTQATAPIKCNATPAA